MDRREEIQKALAKEVIPYVQSHGGDLEIADVAGDTVTIRLLGACSGCPAAGLSTRSLIEEALRDGPAGIKRVELEETVSETLLEFAKQILKNSDRRPAERPGDEE